MPLLENSSFNPPRLLRNGHLQSIWPTLFRKREAVQYSRERFETPDCDFIDIDRIQTGRSRVVLILHGLEGSAAAHYVLGMAKAFAEESWDVAAMNFRGCSGELNRHPHSYHSGQTADLDLVISQLGPYRQIALVGFSIGGNIVLKYLGEKGDAVSSRLTSAVCFAVPCDLKESAERLARPQNSIYMKRFMHFLGRKMRAKGEQWREVIDLSALESTKTFHEFDGRYTAPLNGFLSAEDYWSKASSKSFLESIRVPTLLVNAKDDPFLGPECYPVDAAKNNPYFFLEMPNWGGHVGFIGDSRRGRYWSERRALEFSEAALALRQQPQSVAY